MPDITPPRVRLSGASVPVHSSAPVRLVEDTAYIVESGELLVFAVERPDQGLGGTRHFLFSAEAGDLVVGGSRTAGLETVAVGQAGTAMRAMPLEAFTAQLFRDDRAADQLVGRWARAMADGVSRVGEQCDTSTVDGLPALPPCDPSSLNGYHGACLSLLARFLLAAQDAEAARLERSLDRDRRVQERAVSKLAGVLDSSQQTVVPAEGDPLLAALRRVGEHAGIAISEPPRGGGFQSGSRLRRIAKSSGVRVRAVSLDERWWRTDAGPILAFMSEDGRPVAVLPVGTGHYELVDPAKGQRRRVDATAAAALRPEGFTLYRSLPARAVATRELLALGFSGAGRDVARLLGYGFAASLLALLVPIGTAVVFNSIIPTADRSRLLVLVIVLVLGAVAAALVQVGQGLALVRLETQVDSSVQSATWDRLLRLPAAFFRRYSVGDLANRALSMDAIRQILAQAGFSTILTGIFSLSSAALLVVFDPALAAVALVLVAIAVGVAVWLSAAQLRLQREQLAARGQISGLVVEQLAGVSRLRVTASEGRAFGQWADAFADQQRLTYRLGTLRNLQTVFNGAWPAITTFVLFWWLALRGPLGTDPGAFLAFFAAFGQILVASRTISANLGMVLQTVPMFERMRPIFDETLEVDTTKEDPGVLAGAVEVGHVTFRYVPEGPTVLEDVHITVDPGQFVAVVGPSGAGKSSLIRLLLAFEAPEAGSVYFDGQDLASLDVELVRRQIGVVLQTAQLTPGTIFSNIVGAAGALDRDAAWAAAAQAGLDEDVRQMPMGMDTVISEGGSAISGGQRQRLLIARALAAQPKLLLFDEATSALDNITQKTVSDSLARLNVTRIVIAHRLSTIRDADRIIVMERGRVVETGTYDSLMANDGPFRRLAERQIA